MTEANIPPHNLDAEDAIIGALLLDNAAWPDAAARLSAADFYGATHRAAFAAVGELLARHAVADVITVAEHAGLPLAWLNACASSVPTARHVVHHAGIVLDLSRRRVALGIARELQAAIMQQGSALPEVLDAAAGQLLDLQAGAVAVDEPQHITQLLPEWIDALEARANGRTDAISTGLTDVDRVLDGGLRPGDLCVVGARPSMGKSALALTLARHMAKPPAQQGASANEVLVCSMEDSRQMLVSRKVAGAGRINLADLRRPPPPGQRLDTMWLRVSDAVEELQQLHISVDDQPALSLQAVRHKVQQVKRRRGRCSVLFLDYLQLMEDEGETRAQELTKVARGLKSLAKAEGIAIVLLSQLSRKADETKGPPALHHLAESGGIEQAADVIGLLFRWCRVDKKRDPSEAQVEFVKVKNGPTDTVRLHFDGAHQCFRDAAQEEYAHG